jgi:hypothetical protein
MTVQRQKQRTLLVSSPIRRGAALLGDFLTVPSMRFWLERIKPRDIARLWKGLRESASDAPSRTTWARWENGTTSMQERLVDVIVNTTEDGFALHFIVSGTSKSNGAKDDQQREPDSPVRG